VQCAFKGGQAQPKARGGELMRLSVPHHIDVLMMILATLNSALLVIKDVNGKMN
jgi:hypothetical protein